MYIIIVEKNPNYKPTIPVDQSRCGTARTYPSPAHDRMQLGLNDYLRLFENNRVNPIYNFKGQLMLHIGEGKRKRMEEEFSILQRQAN